MDKTKIAQLYYRYKQRTDKEAKQFLEGIMLLQGKNGKFYSLNTKSKKDILNNIRTLSINFSSELKTNVLPQKKLVEYKKITFLVKSSSRFFLKADIGEVIDQLDFDDFHCPEFKAICVNGDEYELLEGTEGEHFLMTATLYK